MATQSEMLATWLNGTPTGGPNSDGRYPLVYKDGNTYLVYCPAAQALNPTLAEQPVELFTQQAQTAATDASTYAAEADADRISAQASAANAAQSEANALASKNAAAASASTASTKASEASTSAASANAAASTATTAKNAAEAAEAMAQKWADESQDVVVEGTSYSAKHWAQKAQAAATGTLKYKGSWDATTAFPASPVLGDFWKVSVAGNGYNVGDQILYNGSGWDKIDNTEQVTSVAGRTGAVTLGTADVSGLDAALDRKFEDYYKTQGTIPGGVDLNTYTTPGIYHQSASANAASGSNYPIAAAGMLVVYAASVMVYQTYQRYNTGARWHRSYYNGVWSVWHLSYDTANFDPATKADASTAVTTNTSQAITAVKKFSSSAASGTVSTEQPLTVYQGTTGADAFMTFHVVGDHAFQFGLDGTTNDLFVGGWSKGAVKHKVFHEGNTLAGVEASAFRAGRFNDQAVFLWGDAGGNRIRSLSQVDNAKALIIDSTTNSADAAPTAGGVGISMRVRGSERLAIGDSAVTASVNLVTSGDVHANGAYYYGDSKAVIKFDDSWLRLNPSGSFASGIYCGTTGMLRHDGALQIGASATAGLYATTSVFNYQGNAVWHSGSALRYAGNGVDANSLTRPGEWGIMVETGANRPTNYVTVVNLHEMGNYGIQLAGSFYNKTDVWVRTKWDLGGPNAWAKIWTNLDFDPATKQNVLGFTPVEQGTGIGQLGNVVKIGWSGSALKCTVDGTDLGTFVFGTKAQGSTASTVVERNGSGDIYARLFRSEFGNQTTISGAMAFRVNNTTDNYIRFCSDTGAIKTWLGAVSNGGEVSGIVKLTQAAYNALGTKDANTMYVIVG